MIRRKWSSIFAGLLFLTSCTPAPDSIHEAARQGDAKAVQKFLDQNAALATADSPPRGRTPLHLAKTAEIVDLLVAKGAKVDATDHDSHTPLASAVSAEVVDALAKHGADLHKAGPYGEEPIFFCEHGEAVSALIAHGANVNAGLPNQPYKTPLWAAILNKRADVTQALLSGGAIPTPSDNYGETYLHVAAENDLPEVVEALIKAGARANAATKIGETPLMRAVSRNSIKAAEALLNNGADPNLTLGSNVGVISLGGAGSSGDASGKTALALASNPAIKDLLAKHGGR
jgi:ankyrin repeat protein